jgi:carbon monoxide dehydrogenase subunit G
MLQINTTIDIDAPINEVWRKLSKIDNVQEWVESVTKSYYSSEQTEGVGAERTCEVRGFGTLREKVVEWHDGETLIYMVEGMPSVVKHAKGTWRLEAINDRQTRVRNVVEIETRYGIFGALMGKFMMKPQMTRLMKSGTASFKEFVEQSVPEADASARPLHAHVA